MRIILVFVIFILINSGPVRSQGVASRPEYIISMTAQWKGERLPDGRPKVSDGLLQRLKKIQMEEAWGFLRGKGYHNQYEGNWEIINPDSAMTGRVVTAQYMPLRPDFQSLIKKEGAREKRDTVGGSNSWPIEILIPGDVYVADGYGRIIDGTLIGSNLGNAIYANSGNGVVFDAGVRDVAGLLEIAGFNGWFKGADPSYLQQEMLTTINKPIRIGRAIVLPGDVVLANRHGTIFIPAYLVDQLVLSSEVVSLRDQFGFQRLKEKRYTPGQIDTRWTAEINSDFREWIRKYPDNELPMERQQLEAYLDEDQ